MPKMRVYIDTSVIGGCLDEEFKEASLRLFEEFAKGLKIPLISEVLIFELDKAPEKIKEILNMLENDNVEYVYRDEESDSLAKTYIAEGILPENSINDARHIAIATVNRADVLVSWNFKHIVNLNRIHQVNAVNLKMGYPILEISRLLKKANVGVEDDPDYRRGLDST